jgi:hypothetical protein
MESNTLFFAANSPEVVTRRTFTYKERARGTTYIPDTTYYAGLPQERIAA